jgi:hypothetical protein
MMAQGAIDSNSFLAFPETGGGATYFSETPHTLNI